MTLEFGFDVVFWNYRGYGSSTGSPSPKVCMIFCIHRISISYYQLELIC